MQKTESVLLILLKNCLGTTDNFITLLSAIISYAEVSISKPGIMID